MSYSLLQLMSAEWMLTGVLFLVLLIKLGTSAWPKKKVLYTINGLLVAIFFAGLFSNGEGWLFGDMFHSTKLIRWEKNLLCGGTLLVSMMAYDWLFENENVEEFYFLLLSTLLGMYLMISAGNLLMFYLSLELSTIPLATLANFDLAKKRSSEGAMKFIVSSAFSSGLLLFGISLLYGTTGTLSYSGITPLLDGRPLQSFAFVLIAAGFAFKISVVPFHLWTADVYEGAPVAVTAYLSAISKAAIFFVLVPILYIVFKPLFSNWYKMLLVLSVLTMTVGNLFAIRQRNLKRLLAFSSIVQVGFILVGLSGSSLSGYISVLYFVVIYILSNLGAFGVVAIVSSMTGKESLDHYAGMSRTNPLLAWMMSIALFSLAGIPPTAGFFGKFFLLMAGADQGNYWLIVVAALNMIVSMYYYLRIVQTMFGERNENSIEKIPLPALPSIALLLCLIGILVIGLAAPVYESIRQLAS